MIKINPYPLRRCHFRVNLPEMMHRAPATLYRTSVNSVMLFFSPAFPSRYTLMSCAIYKHFASVVYTFLDDKPPKALSCALAHSLAASGPRLLAWSVLSVQFGRCAVSPVEVLYLFLAVCEAFPQARLSRLAFPLMRVVNKYLATANYIS